MAAPWEKYQSTAQSDSSGPWSNYQSQQSAPNQGADVVSSTEQKYGIPSGLLSAVISKESSGNSNAVSPKGALGLGQVMPATAKEMGYDVDQLKRDPNMQVDAAGQYLGQMLRRSGGDVTKALASYNWGPGNVDKYQSGQKKNMPSETQNYINDPRFSQWTNQQQPQAGSDAELDQLSQQTNQPWRTAPPSPTIGDDFEQAGKGLLQTGVNIANIPNAIENTAAGAVRDLGNYIGGPVGQALVNDANRPGATDTIKGGAAYIGNKIGIGDGTYQPGTGFQLPESLQPTDEYAKTGAEIGSYLVPGPGEVNAVSRAAPLVERAGNALSHMLSENVVGTLANSQQNGQIDPNQLLANTALGVAGSAGARAIPAAFNGARNAVHGSRATREVDAAVDDSAPVSAADTAAPQQPTQQAATPPSNTGSPTEEALRTVSNSPPKDIASSLDGLNINPDQDILNSANNLGVADNLLPSHYSGNDQYRAVEQAIKSRKGSALQVQENQAINDLAKRSGQMIDEVAGLPDALGVSDKFNNEMTYRMKALENRSDQLYARVDNAMPPAKPVDANQTLSHLESNADQLGGWDNLDPVEQRVYKALTPTDNGVVTYANLNKQRRLIGSAIGKNAGPYKDADQAALKQLYGALSQDQLTALGDTGAARDFQVANRLVQMRKTLEDNSIALRSKTLTGDVTYSASTALKAMQSGNGKPFRDLMANIPSRKMRSEILATGIRDMLSNGKRGSDFNPGGFADWWQNLQSTGQLKLLSQHLPKEFMSGLADVYNVARGIQRANKDHITTGALVEFTNRFNRVTQSHEMAAKYAQRVGLVVGAKAGPFGSLVGDSIGAKIAAKARQKGGAGSADAAEKLISSPEFQAAAKKAQASKSQPLNQKAADLDTAARKTKVWHDFYNSLPGFDKKIIARIGIVGWLSEDLN